jgi:Helix-turn-helix of insertion element transposase
MAGSFESDRARVLREANARIAAATDAGLEPVRKELAERSGEGAVSVGGGEGTSGLAVGGLRPEQERAITLLISGTGVTETAKEVGVSRQTLYAWMKDSKFAAARNQWHDEMREEGKSLMHTMIRKAAGAVDKALESGDGRLGLRMLEKMGVVKDEEAGPTDAEEIEEKKIARKKKELARKKENAEMKTAELGIVEW